MIQNHNPITLIGEEIAGEWNSDALDAIAAVFGGSYLAYNAHDRPDSEYETSSILRGYDCLMAAENLPGAQSIYTFRPPRAGKHALLVGNEAKGLRRCTRRQAHTIVEIPLPSRNINCLNVAAAAAVMLYFLSECPPLKVKHRTRSSHRSSRPDLLLIGGSDPMELGSTIRSACAFGWERVFLHDAGSAWYACDRRIKSEGRGAARRGRNPIKVIPYREGQLETYQSIVVFTSLPLPSPGAQPHPVCGALLPQDICLAERNVLIVLQDETADGAPWIPPMPWNGTITYAVLPRAPRDRYHFRQFSAIAIAEVARQLGEPAEKGVYLKSKKDRYRRAVGSAESGAELDLEALSIF